MSAAPRPSRRAATLLYEEGSGSRYRRGFFAFDDGSVLTVNAALPYIAAIRRCHPPSGRDGASLEASHFYSDQASDQLSESMYFDPVLKALGQPRVGPPGPGLFEKCIRRKRNVDGGVLADRFLDRRELAPSERRTVEENIGGLRFKVHRNRSSNRSGGWTSSKMASRKRHQRKRVISRD